MKLLILLVILYPLSSYSATPVVIASVAATNNAIRLSQLSQSRNNSQEALLRNYNTNKKTHGVMTCNAHYFSINAPGAYDMFGCQTRGQPVSINRFFKKFRRKESFEITNVLYNDHTSQFIIYYVDNKNTQVSND